MIRVFLVEDHELFASGVRTELGAEFELVGQAGTVEAAIEGVAATEPDVVLLDVHLPDGSGASVVERCPGVRVLALSVSDAAEDVIALIRASARGYVTKSISPAELGAAIRRVHEGDAVFSPRLAGFVLDAFGRDRGPADRPRARPAHPPRARGPPVHRARLRVQGDRARTPHQREDRRDTRERGASEAAADEPTPAESVGCG